MAREIKSGIYLIFCHANEKMYVGSAVDFEDRWGKHLRDLRAGDHTEYMRRVWEKYGAESFTVNVLEYVDLAGFTTPRARKAALLSREQFWLDWGFTSDPKRMLNTCRVAGSRLGSAHSEESKAKNAASQKLAWADQGLRGKLAEASRNTWARPGYRAEQALLRATPEYREKASKALTQLWLEHEGRVLPLKRWAIETGISYATLYKRVKSGWPPARVLNKPVIAQPIKGWPVALR